MNDIPTGWAILTTKEGRTYAGEVAYEDIDSAPHVRIFEPIAPGIRRRSYVRCSSVARVEPTTEGEARIVVRMRDGK